MRTRLLLLLLFTTSLHAQLAIRYRTENTAYLNAGSASGVAVGDRFEVVRANKVIATLEVIFVAEQSASARIAAETTAVQAGDAVRRIGAPVTRPAQPPPAITATTSTTRDWAPSLSGVVSFDAEEERTLGRASVRARSIAGLPLEARARIRLANEAGQDRNRLYELSLLYEPLDGRVAVQAGRIGNSPLIGLGYLDGILGSVQVIDAVRVGGFFGYRPDVTELSPDTSTTKYGAFVQLEPVPMAALTIAGVRMTNDSDETTFVAIDGRYAPHERLSLFAHGRAGISDTFDDDERGVDTILTAVARVTPTTTLTASYERVQPGLDDDLRTTDQVIDDYLRQGFKVALRGRHVYLAGGIRSGGDDEREDNDTLSATAGVSHPDLFGMSAGISATGFKSPFNDGLFVNARLGRRFGAGHLAELTAGALVVDESALDDMTITSWIRGGVWVELPRDLFARGEVELTGGDTPTGQRISLGVGYRF